MKVASFESLSLIGTKLGLFIQYGILCMFMQSKVIYKVKDHQRSSCKIDPKEGVNEGQMSCEVNL